MPLPATASTRVAVTTPGQTYYHTLSEIAAFLRVSRETIHRWLDPRSGLIRCPNGRTLPSLRFGERRLVSASAWAAFVALDTPPAQAISTSDLPPPTRRGRPRKGVAT